MVTLLFCYPTDRESRLWQNECFTLRKDKTTQPPHYIVIFKAKDADNLEQAFREFTAETLSKEQRPSIRKVLTAAKQKAAQQPKRAKEKINQRGLER